jgi:rhamnulokinase
MKKPEVYLGVDLGAESGRVIAGVWDGKTLQMEELHRFSNGPVSFADSLRWDVLKLWSEIQTGLGIAAKKFGKSIVSVGVDTWGVDFVLLTKNGEILGQPYHYRDARTVGMMDAAFKVVPRTEIFKQTGLQFMELNTLYQLIALTKQNPDLLKAADTLLLMPDFLHWCLCGVRAVEYTNGTTTQCMHPTRRDWSKPLLKKFGIPTNIFPQVVHPCTKLGTIRESVMQKTGLGPIQVVAPPTHDTGAAVAGIPTANSGKANWAYISSGTWSLMGIESQTALLSDRVQELNFTNEGGIDNTYRVLKNIAGLWLVQQCKRSFEAAGKSMDYAELVKLAEAAPALRSIVNPNDARFLNPPDMPKALQSFCKETKQPVPKTEGELVRCALESLALIYRTVLNGLEELSGTPIEVIHIVGGGSKNDLLNQFTANACGRPVVAGPVETTVLGNLLSQVRANGRLKSLAQMRDVVRESSDLKRFEPQDTATWTEAHARFTKLL